MRQSALLADIGDCLLSLDSKLRLYEKDGVFLKSATQDIQDIKEQSISMGCHINFLGLELLRSLIPNSTYGECFYKKHQILCSTVQCVLSAKEGAVQVAYQFIDDPHSLLEHRLLFVAASHREANCTSCL